MIRPIEAHVLAHSAIESTVGKKNVNSKRGQEKEKGQRRAYKLRLTAPTISFVHVPASTMSFIATCSTSLLQCLSRPGPSRLASRLQPCSACAQQLRQASSSTTEAASTSDAVGSDADVVATENAAHAAAPVKGQGYDTWLRSVGRQYKDAPTSGPNWLGGHVVRLFLSRRLSMYLFVSAALPNKPYLPPSTSPV